MTEPLPVKKGDRVRFAIQHKEGSTFKRGDILTITDVSHPFYWARRKDGEKGLFYRYELEVPDATPSK